MATEIITTTNTWDDVDFAKDVKTPATETIQFSFGDSGLLSVDLSDANAKAFADAMAPWLAVATPVAVRRTRTTDGTRTVPGRDRTPAQLKAFRQWAEQQGQPVHMYDGGGYRYDQAQLDAYDKAQAETPATK